MQSYCLFPQRLLQNYKTSNSGVAPRRSTLYPRSMSLATSLELLTTLEKTQTLCSTTTR